uniref:Uncharacterized protein n=1 Tax=Parascaris univalens TaxID=6257 RepID=A0A915C5W7_PARUN
VHNVCIRSFYPIKVIARNVCYHRASLSCNTSEAFVILVWRITSLFHQFQQIFCLSFKRHWGMRSFAIAYSFDHENGDCVEDYIVVLHKKRIRSYLSTTQSYMVNKNGCHKTLKHFAIQRPYPFY